MKFLVSKFHGIFWGFNFGHYAVLLFVISHENYYMKFNYAKQNAYFHAFSCKNQFENYIESQK
jgi:hypothetical protein